MSAGSSSRTLRARPAGSRPRSSPTPAGSPAIRAARRTSSRRRLRRHRRASATPRAETFALRQPDAMAIASGPLAAVAAAARVRVASQLWLGVAGAGGISDGELTYYDTTATSKPMATRAVALDVSAELGWGRAWSVAARGGYHHGKLDVESERPEPMLVGEQIRGASVGLGGT